MKNAFFFKGIILVTFFILIGYWCAYHLSPAYPENVAIFLEQQWIYPYLPYFEGLFIVTFIIACMALWFNTPYATRILLTAIMLYLLFNWLPYLKAQYALQSLFEDFLSVLLGILAGFLINKTKTFNLSGIQKLRIICLLFLSAHFACVIVNPIADDLLPRSFLEFVIANYYVWWGSFFLLPLLSLCAFAIFVDPYTPQHPVLRYVNYKTVFVTFMLFIFIFPQRDALTGWSSLVCEIWALLLGVMLTMLWMTRQTMRELSKNSHFNITKEMLSTSE